MELVGRRNELGGIDRALARACSGRRTLLGLRGSAGIGKSALAQVLRDRARERGARVVPVTVTEAETYIGWAGVATVVHGLRDFVPSVSEHQREVLLAIGAAAAAPPIEPLAVAAALAELLRSAAARQPLVLLLDDVHWLDATSAGALSFAIRIVDEAALLVAVAYRPEPMAFDLQRTVDQDDLITVEPRELSVAGVRELIAAHQVELGRVDLVHLHQVTGGNPMHVVEAARALQHGASLHDALSSGSLADLVDESLTRFAADRLPVLNAAALMPSPTIARLERVHPAAEVRSALAAAEAADLIHVEGEDSIVFRHPLVRAGLARRMGTLERRETHRRLAELADDSDVRAAHLAESAVAPDASAATELETAAASAGSRGMRIEAARLARRAFELTDPSDVTTQMQRRLFAADAALAGGDPRRALELLLPVVGELPPGDTLHDALLTVLVSVSVSEGIERCVPWAQRLLAAAPADHPRRSRAHTILAQTMLYCDVPGAVRTAIEAEATARRLGNPRAIDEAESTRLVAEAMLGEPVDVEVIRSKALAAIERGRHVVPASFGELVVWTDQLDVAEPLYEQAVRLYEASGEVHSLLDSLTQLAGVRMRLGDLENARAIIERSLALAIAADYPTDAALRLGELAVVDALTANPYIPVLDAIDRRKARLSATDHMQLNATMGYAELVGGRPERAADALRAAHERAEQIGFRGLGALPYHANLVEALMAIDARDEAATVVAWIADRAAHSGRPRGGAESARAEALLLAGSGDLAGAAAAAERSLEAHRSLTLPIERARVLLLAGAIARRAKRRGPARLMLDEAHRLFGEHGAIALQRRAAAEMNRLGGNRGSELSATEARVAELVVGGRTNDEIAAVLFVSRRTVESNLTRIYRKLGVRSRTELAARLR